MSLYGPSIFQIIRLRISPERILCEPSAKQYLCPAKHLYSAFKGSADEDESQAINTGENYRIGVGGRRRGTGGRAEGLFQRDGREWRTDLQR